MNLIFGRKVKNLKQKKMTLLHNKSVKEKVF